MTATVPQLFDRDGWWDERCAAFRSLRAVTAFRLQLLERWFPNGFAGLRVVDLGCGGGLLTVPLAAAGARVLGVDLGERALRDGARRGAAGAQFAVGDLLRPPVAAGGADLVLLADVLEHVGDPAAAVAVAARLLREGGHLFVNTIARTWRSRLLAIVLAEGLGFVPRGTHRWSAFVQPDELDDSAARVGLERQERIGERALVWRSLRQRAVVLEPAAGLHVGYAALYRRVS